ncbi:MAG: AAA family ATPase [Prevotella sp.]|nr:AAA family ATPase [Prevotella sp.]
MQNFNRLIEDFKNLSQTTVWKRLDAMADNYAVYSTHLKGLTPFLTDFDVYIYCNDTNLVILCLDCCGHDEKHIYEECDSLGSIIFTQDEEPRSSVVWKLAETVSMAKLDLQDTNPLLKVHGVLLTEAEILNAYELYELWEAHNITVIDNLRRLKNKTIRVNEDDDLSSKSYVRQLIDKSMETTDVTRPTTIAHDNDDEFERLLKEFINEGFEPVNEDFLPPINHEEDSDDEDTDDDNTTTDDIDAVDYPSGEIEQNQNFSVKVEILRPIANPREELDRLVGCADIKRRMDELVALTSYNRMMLELYPNSKQHNVSLHSVFLGRPGTGKTTVCKIYGSLLHQAGALSKGHVVVCDRGTFIGTLWGDEERAMRQALEMAKGGVLMIDEAYLLNGKNDNDPGKIVIQLLMNILADETQRDIAVVLCGYKDPMLKLLATNPGLQSRFPNKFEFTDFTVDELVEISIRRISSYDYQFTNSALEKYRNVLTQAYQVRDPETWGNARFVANLLERIYIQHATRCVRHYPKDKHDLLMLTPDDIVSIETPRQRPKIGF